jgi:hypothetical protein
VYGFGALPRTAGVELGALRELNEMATKNDKALTNDACHLSAADLADKIVVLMQHGLDPLFISTSTWALVQTRQYQAINCEEALINPVGG